MEESEEVTISPVQKQSILSVIGLVFLITATGILFALIFNAVIVNFVKPEVQDIPVPTSYPISYSNTSYPISSPLD
jgi:hypothetical protein